MAKSSLTGLRGFVEGFRSLAFVIGIDVHKRSYSVALRRSDGKAHALVVPASPEALLELIRELGICVAVVAYEAGPTGFRLARVLKEGGFEVIVAAPSKVPRPVSAGAKCDRLDCLKLADFAAKGMLRAIAIPTEQEEAKRTLLRRRHGLVDSIRRCKLRIKSQLLFLGIEEPEGLEKWSARGVMALEKLSMEPSARLTLESYLRELKFHKEELRTIEVQLRQIVKECEESESISCMQTVPGVGPTVAMTFAFEIFRPGRFRRAEEVSSYLGLAPMVRHSGGKTPSGKIAPVGQKQLRSLLIEVAWMWKTRDRYASELYNRLISRTGIAQKAITALARRLAIILWRLSIEKRAYRLQTI